MTNSERRISRQRVFRSAPGESRADWWMFSQLGRRMGFADAFAYANSAQIFREHAALSAFENDGARAFDIGALAKITDEAYDALEPVQWPVRADGKGTPRLFTDGHFSHPDGRARFIATPFRPPAEAPDAARAFMLNTGRVRDQWHTMTRTGIAPRLASHEPEPLLDMHPQDAARAKIAEGGFARIESRHGATLMRVRATQDLRPGEVFIAMHWSETNSSVGPADRLVGAACDPVSGQPELKATAVMVTRAPMAWHGLLLERGARKLRAPDYWCRSAIEGGFAYRIAGASPLAPCGEAPARDAIAAWIDGDAADLAVYADAARGAFRYAHFRDGALAAVLFIARDPGGLPSREAAGAMFAEATPLQHRARVLAGAPISSARDEGPIVCACHVVGRARIIAAIASGSARDVEAISAATRAGSNCGSCKPEIAAICRQLVASTGAGLLSREGA